jgi:hypothetical protein
VRQLPVRLHLGEQGVGFNRRVHNPSPLNVSRRNALGRVRQQFQDLITLGALGRMASMG